jgi:hypothetical protein
MALSWEHGGENYAKFEGCSASVYYVYNKDLRVVGRLLAREPQVQGAVDIIDTMSGTTTV